MPNYKLNYSIFGFVLFGTLTYFTTYSLVATTAYAANDHNHDHSQMTSKFKSDYAGQQNRIIKSLSASDISQLQNGKGWGLAKAAELNGVPGPKHLLEMSQQIKLSTIQLSKIKKIYQEMKNNAVALGVKLIASEKQLNLLFANKTVDKKSLKSVLTENAELRNKLRYEHLSTHLKMPAILSSQQIMQYNLLRGYATN